MQTPAGRGTSHAERARAGGYRGLHQRGALEGRRAGGVLRRGACAGRRARGAIARILQKYL